ncbi:MAG: S-layer homology domain-containing protein [Oscillospiraceae bacterium]|nr:S-layer homology domain-containing protein [Oscillospiraceae bacterium]MCI9403578.1 S-layer homology domain-containing protein [Oscillospiraceae bacterium]
MKKRILPTLLALTLTISLLPSALAAPAAITDMAQVLSALDIMTGNENGDLMLSRRVSRAEFTKLIVAASPMGENVGASTTVSPYPDVPYSHWAAPHVEAAVAAGYVNGYLDGTFHPDEDITLAMGVTMAVRLLGYTDADFSGAWPSGQMTLYRNLNLDEGISIGQDSYMTRQDAMYLFYNLLTAKTKQGQPYLTTLGHSLTMTGEIDRVALINAAMDGPVVMTGDWQSKVNFDVNTATVYRGGNPSSLGALQANDVIYWSKSMRTLWAYSNKVTGLYQAASPNASSPSAVTVAGKTYAIETADAAYALSNLGSYKTGDTVTLLLGRDGGVAAVTASSSVTGTLYGVVSAVADAGYTDQGGSTYNAKTVTFVATDGNTYSYPVDSKSSFKAGNLVQVTTASGGTAHLSRLSQSSTSGKFNGDGSKLGSTPLSDDVEILDVNGDGLATRLWPSRLAGIALDSGDVKYVRKNAAGEIDRLILNDVTGDIYSYGVLTSVSETDLSALGGSMFGVYQYDVGGVSYTYQMATGILNQTVGPVRIEGNLYAPGKISKLNSVKLASVDALTAVATDNTSFPVWSSVAVYELSGSDYRLSSLERVRTGYTLTGYYDKSISDGGCIRVIVAKEQ